MINGVTEHRVQSLMPVWLPLPAEEESDKVVYGSCYPLMSRASGFMMIFPLDSGIKEQIVGLAADSGLGIEPAFYEGVVDIIGPRAKALGSAAGVLVDLPWEFVENLVKAVMLRGSAARTTTVRAFKVEDVVGKPAAASSLELANQWISSELDEDSAQEYLTGVEAEEELQPSSPAQDEAETLRARVAQLESELKAAQSNRPAMTTASPHLPTRGKHAQEQRLFVHPTPKMSAVDLKRLQQLAGTPPDPSSCSGNSGCFVGRDRERGGRGFRPDARSQVARRSFARSYAEADADAGAAEQSSASEDFGQQGKHRSYGKPPLQRRGQRVRQQLLRGKGLRGSRHVSSHHPGSFSSCRSCESKCVAGTGNFSGSRGQGSHEDLLRTSSSPCRQSLACTRGSACRRGLVNCSSISQHRNARLSRTNDDVCRTISTRFKQDRARVADGRICRAKQSPAVLSEENSRVETLHPIGVSHLGQCEPCISSRLGLSPSSHGISRISKTNGSSQRGRRFVTCEAAKETTKTKGKGQRKRKGRRECRGLDKHAAPFSKICREPLSGHDQVCAMSQPIVQQDSSALETNSFADFSNSCFPGPYDLPEPNPPPHRVFNSCQLMQAIGRSFLKANTALGFRPILL